MDGRYRYIAEAAEMVPVAPPQLLQEVLAEPMRSMSKECQYRRVSKSIKLEGKGDLIQI